MTIIIGIILLGFLVFFHELGHFLASKACGVKVEAFSIGMGPILLHKKLYGTDWRLSLLPFGGYCSMKGEKDFEEAWQKNIQIDNDSFYGVKAIFRAIIGFAGPFSNFLFSVFAFFVIALTGYTYYSAGNKIQLANEVYPQMHSAAAEAGIKTGDRIIKINGKEVIDFSSIYEEVAVHPDEDITIVVSRDENLFTFNVHTDLNKETGEGKIGIISDPTSIEKRESPRYSLFPALQRGFSETFKVIFLSFKGIASLFKGVDVKETIAGPARITSMLGDTAKSGFSSSLRNGIVSVLNLLALISVSLFIMNLLPIPILDGFLVLTSLIEAFSGLKVSPKVRNVVQYIGIALIAFLFLLAITGDFHYFSKMLTK